MSGLKPVLYVEDDENDVFLLQTAFRRAAVANPLLIVRDGADAVECLSAANGRGPLPCLVITDLKMPRLDGFTLLQWAQTQPHLKELPFVVLSSSCHGCDTRRAQELAAAEFITKPGDVWELVEVVRSLATKWLSEPGTGTSLTALLPTPARSERQEG